ncbi:MAG TPA: hypothetical protein VML50_18045 [Anaeromyxobacter sp.]|nr:hypothetical protein [Anaeromyxobacter sp.]
MTPTSARLRPPRPSRPRERGAALLIVMVAVAVLTALAVDLSYEARVRLRIAANARDELRATALAQSGVNMARLVLSFQQQLDGTSKQLAGLAGAAGGLPGNLGAILTALQGGAPPAPAKGPAQAGQQTQSQGAASGGGLGIQLWNLVPVNSGLVSALFPGAGVSPSPGKAAPAGEGASRPTAAYGDFEGGFDVKIEDEATKVNLQFDSPLAQTGTLPMQVDAYLRLVCDPKWDPIFDREDANGQRWNRQDVAVHLRDWTDADQVSSNLAVSFPAGSCSYLIAPNPFEPGFGDENYPYDRGPERYKAKNARLDSLDELYLVAGVSDAFMAAFGDHLTVYVPRDFGMNVNTNDPAEQLRIAWLMSEPGPTQGLLADPAFQARFQKALLEVRMGGLLTVTPLQFAQLLEGLGVLVKAQYATQSSTSTSFTDKSVVFRIRALGAAGDVTKLIDAVVTFDPTQTTDPTAPAVPGQPTAGRLIHWREE